MTFDERTHYIGAVALLVRIHNSMNEKQREALMGDAPLARVAKDFNSHNFTVTLEPNGESWMLSHKGEQK